MMSLTFGLFTQVSGSGPLGPLVTAYDIRERSEHHKIIADSESRDAKHTN